MKTTLIYLAMTGMLSLACSAGNAQLMPTAWMPVKVVGHTMTFYNGHSIFIPLYNIKYIDTLGDPGNPPFIVVSAKVNDDKNAPDYWFFAFAAAADEVNPEELHCVGSPGRTLDMMTHKPKREDRCFIGDCMGNGGRSVMSFYRSLPGDGVTNCKGDVVFVKNGKLEYISFTNNEYTIDALLARHCREIPGVDRVEQPCK